MRPQMPHDLALAFDEGFAERIAWARQIEPQLGPDRSQADHPRELQRGPLACFPVHLARFKAMASPMPELAPVTTAVSARAMTYAAAHR
ncbi:MAG TPA: hypothetical protein VFT69_10930 [Pseudolabrys sp.]|jgi:hypothetical protein|nr:hypothetical protein [Pseudolabrys sp.]